jgi:signal transduction histidine kinase
MTSEIGVVSENTVLPGAIRLLIVDDDVAICRQMATGLSAAGFQVYTANSVKDAIAQSSETPPDLAIVDLGMPEMGGLVLISHLEKQLGNSIHIIVLTGQDDERSRAEAFEAGADDYVIKPIGLSEIRRRVAAAMRKQRAVLEVRLAKEDADRRLVYGQEALALLAHDLNNGLAVSLSNLSYLIEVIKGDEDQTEALAATLRSVRRMSGLVANFVDIARFEDAAVKPFVAKTKIRQLLASVMEVNSPSLTRGITFEVDCAPEFEGKLDGGLIERVLHNLVGNATRYCNPGGKIIVAGKRWHDEGSLELSVTNTGPQIPENIRGNLFGKYVQGKGGKRGMGLYFCRLVAEAHGGRMEYEARADGPCFVIRLPGRA